MGFSGITKNCMFDWIARCLDEGVDLPTDGDIVDAFNLVSTEQARTLLSDLADAGRITVRGGYGPDRVITLGRAKSLPATPAPRPMPAVRKVDADVARATEKIMAIVARTPNAAAVKARNAAALLKTVAPTTPAAAKPAPSPRKDPAMPAKTIQLPATATFAIAAVETHAKENDCTIGAAAAQLIDRAMAAPAPAPAPAEPTPRVPTIASIVADLHAVFNELVERADRADQSAALAAAVERAEAAEGKLQSLREALAA